MATLQNLTQEVATKAKTITLAPKAIGHKITTRVPTLSSKQSVSDARNLISGHVKEFDTINYIYILSKSGKLDGVISIKDIFRNSPETQLSKIMSAHVIKAHLGTSQEKAVQMAIQNNIKAIPVVDDTNTFLGVVSSDNVLAILEQETTEDYLRFAGILGKAHSAEIPISKSFIRRIPWIIIGLFGGLVTAKVINSYNHVLENNIILAGFIPLIAYVANAVGTQTQTLYIRDLTVNAKIAYKNYVLRQLATSVIIALACWIIVFSLGIFFWDESYVSFIVGLAIFCAIMMATFFALFLPTTLKKFHFDPAVGSGPFTTIIQDLLSIIIYFVIAEMFI